MYIDDETDQPVTIAVPAQPDGYDALLNGDQHLLHFPGAMPAATCKQVLDTLDSVFFVTHACRDGVQRVPVGRLEPTLALDDSFARDGHFEGYFAHGPDGMMQVRMMLAAAGVFDPLDLLVAWLEQFTSRRVSIARERDGRTYAAGLIQSMPCGIPPHTDDLLSAADELIISQASHIGTMVLFLDTPTRGGALRVFHKSPSNRDRTFHRFEAGYAPEATHGVLFSGVVPTVGDIVIFSAGHLHEVDPVVEGRLISMSVNFGMLDDGQIVIWS